MPERVLSTARHAIESAELVLFDLDGTLVDSVPDLTTALNRMLTGNGLPACKEDLVRQWVGNGARKLVERALSHYQANHVTTEKALPEFLTAYENCNGERTRLYPGARSLLAALGTRRCALVTNKPQAHTAQLLDLLDLTDHFASICGGDTFAEQKPSPLPFMEIMKRLGAPSALVIGDSVNDIRAARAARLPVIGVSYGYNHGRPIDMENPDWVVDSLTKLL